MHKLTAIYYTIGTIPPVQRSELRSIFLWGLFYHSHVKKYGYDKILTPLVNDIKTLQEDNIHLITKDGSPLKFHTQLHLFTADNLSAHDLMGMQTNFNSGKFSRYCMADYDNINMLSDYTLCTLRTQTTNSILLCSPQAPHSIRLDGSMALLAAVFFRKYQTLTYSIFSLQMSCMISWKVLYLW